MEPTPWLSIYTNAMSKMFEDYGNRLSNRTAIFIASRIYRIGFRAGKDS